MNELGHNSDSQLKSIVERIENIGETIKEHQEEQKEIFTEAKSSGYDVKILRRVLALRRQDPEQRAADASVTETYMHALGMGA